ncbi:peptidoglycan DD-metalloendopeptidase family protein [Polaromonas vacuolata]|nr:peptidoglycan DD-metalloendopeptidase family protein [Polaromonas vacuolata]
MALLVACGTSLNKAPVEVRAGSSSAASVIDASIKPLLGSENAGKPGYYTIRPGDTLIRIGLDSGHNWRDIARWNNLENPNQIEVGQVVRLSPPSSDAVTASSTKPVSSPVASTAMTSKALPPAQPASGPVAPTTAAAPASNSSTPTGGDDELAWIWPAKGTVLAGFDESKNKGLDIGGNAGDAVIASADGRVVYSGAGLRGYGNLIILKHNNTYLTAYAHNQTLLVKEDQNVKKGQKIAEMGSSDSDRVKLHFELRRQGKPVDPAKYLPGK